MLCRIIVHLQFAFMLDIIVNIQVLCASAIFYSIFYNTKYRTYIITVRQYPQSSVFERRSTFQTTQISRVQNLQNTQWALVFTYLKPELEQRAVTGMILNLVAVIKSRIYFRALFDNESIVNISDLCMPCSKIKKQNILPKRYGNYNMLLIN